MNLAYFIERFSNNRAAFEGLIKHIDHEQARWKPSSEKWSILEVVNHLYDEERQDFRPRLEIILTDPSRALPPIDPENWVTTRAYIVRDLDTSLNNFIAEREKSLTWLRGLSSPNWENRHERAAGTLSAGDLIASWLAHDFLHIRQLARLHWQYVGAIAQPYQTTYGGPWKES